MNNVAGDMLHFLPDLQRAMKELAKHGLVLLIKRRRGIL